MNSLGIEPADRLVNEQHAVLLSKRHLPPEPAHFLRYHVDFVRSTSHACFRARRKAAEGLRFRSARIDRGRPVCRMYLPFGSPALADRFADRRLAAARRLLGRQNSRIMRSIK